MKIAFTGTRQGMSKAQRKQLSQILSYLAAADAFAGKDTQWHHGGADGADVQSVGMVEQEREVWTIVEHPGGKSPLRRNKEMVEACDLLVAAPFTDREELRSGTWATVRHARRTSKPVIMLSRGL